MKPRALRFRCMVILAVSAFAAHAHAATAYDGKKAAPSATKSAADDAAKKKEDAMGKVDGMEVKRGDGYFGVAVVDGHFQIKFYDAKRHVVAAPVKHIALRWSVKYRPDDERTVLDASEDGKALSGGKIVKGPYLFKLFITFLAEGAVDPSAGAETYTIDFRV